MVDIIKWLRFEIVPHCYSDSHRTILTTVLLNLFIIRGIGKILSIYLSAEKKSDGKYV